MRLDSGLLEICTLTNSASNGAKPSFVLASGTSVWYGERTVSFSRQYQANAVGAKVDKVVRVWRLDSITVGCYAVDEANNQYRIANVQNLTNDDGLQVMDLTLEKLESAYDIQRQTQQG